MGIAIAGAGVPGGAFTRQAGAQRSRLNALVAHVPPTRALPISPHLGRFFDTKKWHNLTVVSDLGSRRTANISSLWASQDLGVQF